MMPQFSKTDEDADFNLSLGITLFLIGLAKKVIVADNLAPHASPVFSHAANDVSFNIFEAWIGTFAYTFQLYFDFSGYSDMALGIAAMFGIFLPVNFLSPYKATNLVEFWRRWHITLSRFLRDYLYFPLGGNRKGKGRELSNLLITMVIGGLWHGANWTFVAWGFLHGLGLSLNHMVSKLTGKFKYKFKALSAVITFLFVSLTWVLFRSENFNSALSMYSTMFAFKGLILPHEMLTAYPIFGAEYAGEFHKTPIAIIMVSGIIAFIAPNSLQVINSAKFNSPIKLPSTRLQWSPSFKWVAFMILLFIACLLNMTNMSEFLYYQF
jgi:D-alanyl-lipoteichoic acid acyltransferase DltB (MBOAT superfamily)